MADDKTPKPTKTTRDKMRRPVKPETLLKHIMEYKAENGLGADDTIQTMIDNLRDDIVAEALL